MARSTCPSKNVQSTPFSDHFWKFRCRKCARRCGAKHACGPLLEVEMSKKCAPLWREAHVQVKMYKAHHSRTTFGNSDVEKVHIVVAQSTFGSQKCQKMRVLSFCDVQMSKKSLTNLARLNNLTNTTNSTNLSNLTNKGTN